MSDYQPSFYDQSGDYWWWYWCQKLIERFSSSLAGIISFRYPSLHGTIAENICLKVIADATRGNSAESTSIANVDSFVQHLDNGYDTVLQMTVRGLSNGAASAYRHARAALANTVLILDEVTSLLTLVPKKNGVAGWTVFVIAHRLSTIVNSDVIMVMDRSLYHWTWWPHWPYVKVNNTDSIPVVLKLTIKTKNSG